jgi:hypothetical protein
MIRKSHFILSFAFMSLVAVSCSKEEGCTDSSATNFSESAEKDDGSCKYKGSVVFWYNQATSNYLTSDPPSQSLVFYVDGAVVGSTAANVYWNSAPACGTNGSITVEKDLGTSKSKSFAFKVVDNNNYEHWSNNVVIQANSCFKLQLSY